MNVAACIVTRGDVDLAPVLASIPSGWETVVWDNSVREDLQVLGRWSAIEETEAELIYVQDDDCVLDPYLLMAAYIAHGNPEAVMCNMPPEFEAVYGDWPDLLVGFGAFMHRDVPIRALARFLREAQPWARDLLPRCCDIAVTGLSTAVSTYVEKQNLPQALAADRMWRQHDHVKVRAKFRSEVVRIRDGR